MALTPYEKQKRWREKNRALYNLQQRNRRKGKGGVKVQTNGLRTEMATDKVSGGGGDFDVGTPTPKESVTVEEIRQSESPPSLPFTTKKVGEFRMIVLPEEKPVETPVSDDTRSAKDVVGGIYRNDFGGVISKSAWEKLQKAKEHAKENNFEIDDYSQ